MYQVYVSWEHCCGKKRKKVLNIVILSLQKKNKHYSQVLFEFRHKIVIISHRQANTSRV